MSDDQNKHEERKLEALVNISKAIATLGSSLAAIIQDNREQTQMLRTVDGKIDHLTDMVGKLAKP